jgi:hypothetical protein
MTERSMNDRRTAKRRRFAFVRGGVLEAHGRNHIVSVADLGPEGAFLVARVPLTVGEKAVLRMVLPRGGREMSLPCEVVWRSESSAVKGGVTTGLAVRFRDLDATVARRVAEFAEEGLQPAAERTHADHFEYRVVELPDVDEAELNRLGFDGWQLASVLPAARSVRLILLRRL